MKSSLYILFIFMTCTAFSQTADLNKTVTADEYSIRYNSDWKLNETKSNGADFYLIHLPAPQKFGNNINLVIQDLGGMNLDLKAFSELSENQIKSNGKLISSITKSKANSEYQELVFEAVYNGFNVRFFQRYYIKNDLAYILTFTSVNTEYDNLYPEAVKIIDSFKLN